MEGSVHCLAALPPGEESVLRGVYGLGGTRSRSDMAPKDSAPVGK